MLRKNILFYAGILLLSVALLAVGYFNYLSTTARQESFQISNFYSGLVQNNGAFAQAEEIRRGGGGAKNALPLYKEALTQATNTAEEAQIKLLVAIMTNQSKGFREAVPLFKEIAANTVYPSRIRAFAIQQMGVILSGHARARAWNVVFSGEPYSSFVIPDDGSLTLRNLYEYASSIYPLAFSEIMIADWYAGKLAEDKLDISSATLSSALQVAVYTDVVRTKLANADQDIARMEQSPLGESNVPLALLRRAVVVGKMTLAGDQSFGDPDQEFKKAEQAYTDRGWSSGHVLFGHAAYLALLYGEKKKKDISQILEPIINKKVYDYRLFTEYLRGLKFLNAPGLTGKLYASLLGSTDQKFKALLMSLGWTEDDFVRK